MRSSSPYLEFGHGDAAVADAESVERLGGVHRGQDRGRQQQVEDTAALPLLVAHVVHLDSDEVERKRKEIIGYLPSRVTLR